MSAKNFASYGDLETILTGFANAIKSKPGTLYADNPIGSIVPYGGATAPSGWFLCHGQAISRTTYADLFAAIGTSFGVGDGSTTFNLPDLREATTKGAGLTGHTVGAHLDADGLAVGEFLDDRVQDLTMKSAENAASPDWKDGFIVRGNTGNTVQYNKFSEKLGRESTSLNRLGDTTEVKSVGVNYIIKAEHTPVPADFMDAVDEAVVENNNYSTTETVVGRWIDGKPIYRRVLTGFGITGTSGEWQTLSGVTISNAEAIVCATILRNISGSDFTCFHRFDAQILSTGEIRVLNNIGEISSPINTIVLEYTKTTD